MTLRHYISLRLWLTVCFGIFIFSAQAFAFEVIDDRQIAVKFDASPQRIVSLLPSLTEMVCELGHCHRLVGVDRYSNYPDFVKPLPKVGGGLDPNIEAIVALRPDVVLMAISTRSHERLTALGVKVLAFEAKNLQDVQKVLYKIGELLEIPAEKGALKVWRSIDASLLAAAQSLPKEAKDLKVYFEVNRAPYAAGTSSFIGEVLTRLGLKNIIPAELGPFPKINPEFVVRANPDIIMIGEKNFLGLTDRPGWAGIRAVKDKHICVFKSSDADVLVRPGPRIAEAARLIAGCIETFKITKAGKVL